MPKIPTGTTALPLSGLFAVNKPSGMTSMALLEALKPLFRQSALFVSEETARQAKADAAAGKRTKPPRRRGRGHNPLPEGSDIKIGQGGTLDPLADGVLVIGINKGTKRLAEFLDCTKSYRSTGLLGAVTDSYDADGQIMKRTPFKHVSRQTIADALPSLRGHIKQTPPIFSALKMDGKNLYEYARAGTPLPRPIEKREVEISQLDLVDWSEGNCHQFRYPSKEAPEVDQALVKEVERLASSQEPAVSKSPSEVSSDDILPSELSEDGRDAPIFVIEMTVSRGTYVRSIVHDIGALCNSGAHVVTLTRTRQGQFALEDCIDWEILASAAEALKLRTSQGGEGKNEAKDEDGTHPEIGAESQWEAWEESILEKIVRI